jgi:hypothetical protein
MRLLTGSTVVRVLNLKTYEWGGGIVPLLLNTLRTGIFSSIFITNH